MGKINLTEFGKDLLKKGVKPALAVLTSTVIAVSFIGCSKKEENAVELENTRIVSSCDEKTMFTNNNACFDNDNKESVILTLGNIKLCTDKSKYPATGYEWFSTQPEVTHMAEVEAFVQKKENCEDFICVVNYDDGKIGLLASPTDSREELNEQMANAFDSYIEGKGNSSKFTFTNVTDGSFTWKTNYLADPSIITQNASQVGLCEEFDTDYYNDYVKSWGGNCILDYATFKIFQTFNTNTFLIRYDYEANKYNIYDLSKWVTLVSADAKLNVQIENTSSYGFQSDAISRDFETEISYSNYESSKPVAVLTKR